MRIKSVLFPASLAVLMNCLAMPGAFAQSSSNGNSFQSSASDNSGQNAANYSYAQETPHQRAELSQVQALGTKSRAGIDQLGIHSVDINRALTLQTAGDRALRDGNVVVAAEDYGRVQEAVSVLKRERVHAEAARNKTLDDVHRAEQNGVNVSQAKEYGGRGDQALNTGNFHTAEVYYAQARAELNALASR
jgi:hypothetical protein